MTYKGKEDCFSVTLIACVNTLQLWNATNSILSKQLFTLASLVVFCAT